MDSQAVVTMTTSDIAENVIDIVPMTESMLEGSTARTEPKSTDTKSRAVVTGASDSKTTGETANVRTNIQQCISEDYAVPEDITSEALLMLQNMSQPNLQEHDDNDEYALPVGTEKFLDIVSEMNEERGIKTVVNYDADIPEEMKLQTKQPRQETLEEGDKDESDDTIIYDVSEYDEEKKSTQKTDTKCAEDGEKLPKGQLQTQMYGIIKRKVTSKRTYTCIDCGAK